MIQLECVASQPATSSWRRVVDGPDGVLDFPIASSVGGSSCRIPATRDASLLQVAGRMWVTFPPSASLTDAAKRLRKRAILARQGRLPLGVKVKRRRCPHQPRQNILTASFAHLNPHQVILSHQFAELSCPSSSRFP